jgi:hypothetical protein
LPSEDIGTEFAFFNKVGSLRECVKICTNSVYHESNQECSTTADCSLSTNLFRETGTLGANAVTSGTLYDVCAVDSCTNFTHFYNDGTENICIDGCQAEASGSYSLEARDTVSNNMENMLQCVESCPAGQVFIPELTKLSVEAGSTVMKCMDNCPTTSTPTTDSIAYLRIKIAYKTVLNTANDFYSSVREMCTYDCSILGGDSYVNIFTDLNSQLTCTSSCPPATSDSSLTTANNDALTKYDAEDSDAAENHSVCVSSCTFEFTDSDSNSRCASTCRPENQSASYTDKDLIFREGGVCKEECETDLYHLLQDTDFNCTPNCNTATSDTNREYF